MTIVAAAAGSYLIEAEYAYDVDVAAARATHWSVWLTSDASTPNRSDPTSAQPKIVFADGVAKLRIAAGQHAASTVIKIDVAVTRVAGGALTHSAAGSVQSATMQTAGPTLASTLGAV